MNFKYLILFLLFFSCNQKKENSYLKPENWEIRKIDISKKDSLKKGKTYLSIYSEIYSYTEHSKHSLTSMVSLRNLSDLDSIYLTRAEYYDTKGKSIRKYFDYPIFLAPMETIEIIIDELDVTGGTGSNFIFEWKIKPHSPEPLFEAIMSTTMNQQGLSFTTTGKKIN